MLIHNQQCLTASVYLKRCTNDNTTDWFIEESRIRGGYNNTSTDIGVKAHIVEDNPNNQDRFNTINILRGI